MGHAVKNSGSALCWDARFSTPSQTNREARRKCCQHLRRASFFLHAITHPLSSPRKLNLWRLERERRIAALDAPRVLFHRHTLFVHSGMQPAMAGLAERAQVTHFVGAAQ